MKFKQEKAEKGGWTKWIHPTMTGYHMACCDCGLVHTINFRAFKVVKTLKSGVRLAQNLPKKEYRVEFKVKRNEKHTKSLRSKK